MGISFPSLQLIACHDPLPIFTLSSQIGNLGIKHIHILKHLYQTGMQYWSRMALRHPGLQELFLVEFTGDKMREDCNKKTCTKVEKPIEAKRRNATNIRPNQRYYRYLLGLISGNRYYRYILELISGKFKSRKQAQNHGTWLHFEKSWFRTSLK